VAFCDPPSGSNNRAFAKFASLSHSRSEYSIPLPRRCHFVFHIFAAKPEFVSFGKSFCMSYATLSCVSLYHVLFFVYSLTPFAKRPCVSKFERYFKPISQLRFDCDTTTTRLRRKMNIIFCSRRMEAGARDTSQLDRSHIAVESQL